MNATATTSSFQGKIVVVTSSPTSDPSRVNLAFHYENGRAVRSYSNPAYALEIEANIDSDPAAILEHYGY